MTRFAPMGSKSLPKHGGLLSTAAPNEVKQLNSRFKAFGSPLGYAYGLEGQDDELGFVSNYAPSDHQEDTWRIHYTEQMFDEVLAATERDTFLYTHSISYRELFGNLATDAENTLKVKLYYWRDGVVTYLDLPHDADLDLTGLQPAAATN